MLAKSLSLCPTLCFYKESDSKDPSTYTHKDTQHGKTQHRPFFPRSCRWARDRHVQDQLGPRNRRRVEPSMAVSCEWRDKLQVQIANTHMARSLSFSHGFQCMCGISENSTCAVLHPLRQFILDWVDFKHPFEFLLKFVNAL